MLDWWLTSVQTPNTTGQAGLAPARAKELLATLKHRANSPMDALPVSAIESIERELLRQIFHRYELESDTLFFDTTNFSTYIASSNVRCQIAQRGRNKQKRDDLRQVGLALVVTRQDFIPLFHLTYKGSIHDSVVFRCVLGYQLAALIWREARMKAGFKGTLDTLLGMLNNVRLAILLEDTGRRGRAKAIYKLEEMPDGEQSLMKTLQLMDIHLKRPKLNGVGVYTT